MTEGRLPNFLVIGAMKAGTGSLHRYLRSHPQIFMPERKESRFFDDSNWSKRVDWYRAQFSGARGEMAVGEASPTYSAYPMRKGVPERISALLPEARFVYLVREPLSRIKSQYLRNVISGQETRRIDEAVIRNPWYLYQTQYAMQLDRYLKFFPRESILVVRTEELRDDRLPTLRKIFAFLKVDPEWSAPVFERTFNTSAQRQRFTYGRLARRLIRRNREMENTTLLRMTGRVAVRLGRKARARSFADGDVIIDEETKEFIHLQLRPDIARLRAFLPDDFDGWGIE